MIIDFHCHIFSGALLESKERYLADEHFDLLYGDSGARLIRHDMLLKAMDDFAVDCSVAMGFPWLMSEFSEKENVYLAETAAGSSGRIKAFGSIPLHDSTNVRKCIKTIKDQGLSGIGEVGFYLDGLNRENTVFLRSILEGARQYGMPVCLHVNEPVGHRYTGKYDPGLSRLYDIVKDFKDVTIIFAHWGGGLFFYELMPEVSAEFSNFYYDTAATPFVYREEIYRAACGIIGSKKILFGSDYPLISPLRYVNVIRDTVADEEDRKNILGANAARILGIG